MRSEKWVEFIGWREEKLVEFMLCSRSKYRETQARVSQESELVGNEAAV